MMDSSTVDATIQARVFPLAPPSPPSAIKRLPPELIDMILSHLNVTHPKELLSYSTVSKPFQKVVKNATYWRELSTKGQLERFENESFMACVKRNYDSMCSKCLRLLRPDEDPDPRQEKSIGFMMTSQPKPAKVCVSSSLWLGLCDMTIGR